MTAARWKTAFACAYAAIAVSACDASPSTPFDYDLTRVATLDIDARAGDTELSGVVVSVRASSADPQLAGSLLWMGATGADGHARATFRADRADGSFEVTLHKRGWRGPWSDESARTSQGLFAPSAQLTLPVAQVNGLRINFERTP